MSELDNKLKEIQKEIDDKNNSQPKMTQEQANILSAMMAVAFNSVNKEDK